MKIHRAIVVFAITAISVGASGQCAKSQINAIWDEDKGEFRCIDPKRQKGHPKMRLLKDAMETRKKCLASSR